MFPDGRRVELSAWSRPRGASAEASSPIGEFHDSPVAHVCRTHGSGKSILKAVLPPQRIRVILNPDDIEQGIRDRWPVGIGGLGVVTDPGEILSFFRSSEFLAGAGLSRNDSVGREVIAPQILSQDEE